MRPSKHLQAKGFTLIEVMMVVAILGILAAVALPRMQLFTYRAKRAERDLVLKNLLRSINAFAANNATPVMLPQNPPEPATAGRKPFQPRLALPDTSVAGWDRLGFAPEGSLYYRYTVVSDMTPGSEVLTLVAEGDLDNDGHTNVRTVRCNLQSGQWAEVSVLDTEDDW